MEDCTALRSLPVDEVRRFLVPYGIEVRELPADTSTAVLAAQALGTTVPAIVKSLVFMAEDEPVLVLAPGDRRVDRARLTDVLRVTGARLAKPEEALKLAGYAVGGVPPVAHRRPLRVLMDSGIFEHPVVYAAAGSPNAVFGIEPERLRDITRAEVVQVAC